MKIIQTVLLCLLASVSGSWAANDQQSSQAMISTQPSVQAAETLNLPLDKSQVLRVGQPVSRIAIGNPDIVDAMALTERSFYVLGKKMGTTNISVYGRGGQLLAVIDVMVGIDVEGVKSALHALMPDDTIDVRSINDSIALSGVLASPARISQAVDVAKRFAGDKVINDMRIAGSQQVMLRVKVAEVQRNLLKNFGFKPFLNAGKAGESNFSLSTLTTGEISNFQAPDFATAAGTVIGHNLTFTEALDTLEQKGVVKILAEPNLIAMSGDTANFLAGGEFPVPVSQTTSFGLPTITVQFKPFGISLAFTPTVVDGDLINLVVAPEVSQIDKTTSVTFNGFTIPGVSTRRAKTTVEVRDGQSFAIAGLLSNNFSDTIRGIPGIMNIPIIGALARSTSYQRDQTELVVIITPHLVQPTSAEVLRAPTDSFVPPDDAHIFLMGKTENPDSGLAPRGAGLTGKYGHIIR